MNAEETLHTPPSELASYQQVHLILFLFNLSVFHNASPSVCVLNLIPFHLFRNTTCYGAMGLWGLSCVSTPPPQIHTLKS